MKEFIWKIRHYGIKRLFPRIVIKNVYKSEYPYILGYYRVVKEGNLYHLKTLKKYQNICMLLLTEQHPMECFHQISQK